MLSGWEINCVFRSVYEYTVQRRNFLSFCDVYLTSVPVTWGWPYTPLCSPILVCVITTQMVECYWSEKKHLLIRWSSLERDREKSSGQANLFNVWTIWATDRTSAQPKVNLGWVCCAATLWNSSLSVHCSYWRVSLHKQLFRINRQCKDDLLSILVHVSLMKRFLLICDWCPHQKPRDEIEERKSSL